MAILKFVFENFSEFSTVKFLIGQNLDITLRREFLNVQNDMINQFYSTVKSEEKIILI
jgi:hypothetical protein